MADAPSRGRASWFGWLGRRREADAPVAEHTADDRTVPTKGLSKFIATLANRESPVLLDLGPVVGANVSFFGERLGCRLLVEDLYADLERLARERRLDTLPEFLATRITQADGSVDGILCWDAFDHLDKASAPVLARELVRVLSPGGALFAMFATAPSTDESYTRFSIVDEQTLSARAIPASRPRQRPTTNRDINRLFDTLRVTESFLLLTQVREVLLRK
ncbi:MAG: class I SAM-dependent methyltransferase [Vicinamibacteraceae bacterium]|nr:class I SAM-dependent methyltransferase [Vicinamibacteraceae bacterium]